MAEGSGTASLRAGGRVPLGQADRHAVLAAPTLSERVDVLIDAIETVAAMVEFQLSED